MKVKITAKTTRLLQDPAARQQLQQVLATGDSSEIKVGKERYRLVSIDPSDPEQESD